MRAAWAVCLALAGCAGGAGDSGQACADAPVVTWETFGHGFVTENCQTCHASSQTERQGAPPAVSFDDAASVWAYADRVLATAAAEPPTMPPMGGTTEDDRALLRTWLTCAEPGQ